MYTNIPNILLLCKTVFSVQFDGDNSDDIPKERKKVRSKDYQLSMDLLADYPAGYNVLPTDNPFDVVNVSFQMALYSIVDMNERDQTLTTNCEIITKWHDAFLIWDPEKYDNIQDTRLPWDKVWTPDIVLYNSAGDGEQGREMRTLIQVTYDGNVTLLTHSIYMSKCIIDVTYYPFDAQVCELKFSSWTTEVNRINMTIGTISRKKISSLYGESGVFELRSIHARRHEQADPCCEEPFADVTYYLCIMRRPKFFLFNYIQPAVLINILALFVFLIPAESGEKITLGISTMLNMTVFLMTIMTGLPPTNQTPIISIYYAITMVLTTAATVFAVIILRIHHHGRRGLPVPPYLRTLFQWLAILSFSTYPSTDKLLEELQKGGYSALPQDDYVYNIKDELSKGPRKSKSAMFKKGFMQMNMKPRRKVSESKKEAENRPAFPIKSNQTIKTRMHFSIKNRKRGSNMANHSEMFSDSASEVEIVKPKSIDCEQPVDKKPTIPKPKSHWKTVSKTIEVKEEKAKETAGDAWKDLSNKLMEEKWKAEERKEILGEEWRKMSRILDRFLLITFSLLSIISTVWCIYTSPHFPKPLLQEQGGEEETTDTSCIITS